MKILLIKFFSLGDVLQTTPLIFSIKTNYPDAKIDYLTSLSSESLLIGNKLINNLYVTTNLGATKNYLLEIFILVKLIKLFFKLRKNNYDGVFLLHRNKILKNITKISAKQNFYSLDEGFDIEMSRYQRMYALFNLFRPLHRTIDVISYTQNFEVPDILQPYVVIAPGGGDNPWSSMPSRRWPINNFRELINILSKDYRVVIIGGKNDKHICDQLNSLDIIDYCGTKSIKELANILKFADRFIGHDSMPYFLASAIGSKALGLFGPTNPSLIVPHMDNAFWLQGKACMNCYDPVEVRKGKAYTCTNNQCMQSISVEMVREKLKDITGK